MESFALLPDIFVEQVDALHDGVDGLSTEDVVQTRHHQHVLRAALLPVVRSPPATFCLSSGLSPPGSWSSRCASSRPFTRVTSRTLCMVLDDMTTSDVFSALSCRSCFFHHRNRWGISRGFPNLQLQLFFSRISQKSGDDRLDGWKLSRLCI